jgi:rifampicin phosphotransferase
VVVQKMVAASASGIAFGINPLNGNKEESLVNAIGGYGEDLVAGKANGDGYSVRNNQVLVQTLAGADPVLSVPQVLRVARELRALEKLLGAPQDIEFAFDEEDFFLLQSRPVTKKNEDPDIIWDNSNIIESYPGLTLPLTFSFIEKMYEAVYRQFSMVLGVSESRIREHSNIYAQMLGLLNGRVYYNLNSWFGALAQLPGYSVNAGFMEKMMGVKEKFEGEVPGRKSKGGIAAYLRIANGLGCILSNLVSIKKQRRKFIRDFNEVYDAFKDRHYENESLSEIWLDYKRFEQLMLSKWKAPLVNDFFAMVYFGLLQKTCLRYSDEDANLHNKLIGSSKDIVTTEPMRRLPLLAAMVHNSPQLKALFLGSDPKSIWEALQRPEHKSCHDAIRDYLNDWGERCVAELKLETITYRQAPELLIGVIKSYVQQGIITQLPQSGSNDRLEAEKKMRGLIRGPMNRMLFAHVLKKARYLVSNRENLRYFRTRGFGMVRTMMLAMGKKMKEEGWIEQEGHIFYLELKEVEALAQGRLDPHSLMEIISGRMRDYELFEERPLPERIKTKGKPGKFILYASKENAGKQKNVTELKGIPCSPGVVHARVRMVNEPQKLEALNQQIMASYATDPGFVVLFASASGILTERGSLLSHAAIVSREMGIPCIVGIEGLMEILNDGDELIMDGSTGMIQLLKKNIVA